MSDLKNKVAVITGAAFGIGRGIAEVFSKYGANLLLLDTNEEVHNVANELMDKYNNSILSFVADVSKKSDVNNAINTGIEKFQKIDIACCNAGVCRLKPFIEMDDSTLDFHINVNIKGVWNTCQAVIANMLKNDGGNIVIASSVTGDIVADPGESAYALTKSALVGLTKALAVEFAPNNIRVNCTQLGYAKTPMVEKMALESCPEDPDSVINSIAGNVPLGRLATPNDVGELFAFLASDDSSYITGAQFVIDGAATLPETPNMGTK